MRCPWAPVMCRCARCSKVTDTFPVFTGLHRRGIDSSTPFENSKKCRHASVPFTFYSHGRNLCSQSQMAVVGSVGLRDHFKSGLSADQNETPNDRQFATTPHYQLGATLTPPFEGPMRSFAFISTAATCSAHRGGGRKCKNADELHLPPVITPPCCLYTPLALTL